MNAVTGKVRFCLTGLPSGESSLPPEVAGGGETITLTADCQGQRTWRFQNQLAHAHQFLASLGASGFYISPLRNNVSSLSTTSSGIAVELLYVGPKSKIACCTPSASPRSTSWGSEPQQSPLPGPRDAETCLCVSLSAFGAAGPIPSWEFSECEQAEQP